MGQKTLKLLKNVVIYYYINKYIYLYKMDDFKLQKMLKREWVYIEQPIEPNEILILNLIKNGYDNVNIKVNQHQLLNELIKIEDENSDYYIYTMIVEPFIKKNLIKYIHYKIEPIKIKKKMSGKDFIRLSNQNVNIEKSIEIIILLLLKKLIKYEEVIYFYNIQYLMRNYCINSFVTIIIQHYISQYTFNSKDILTNSSLILENNPIFNYKPIELYEHQKNIYTIFKKKQNCLVFYNAPTSSGKTLTPIGLSQDYKIIFICASRHIGLNLAKSAINVGKKIGFAFGCETIDDIRLHFFAINTYSNDKYKKPIHSDGIKVEMLICDLYSFENAMLYMKSFFPIHELLLFWDEPTISMDYEEHPLHKIVKHNWTINEIPNIILSSATLPNNLNIVIENYKQKYKGEFYKIETIDENNNITLIDNEGYVIMPHRFLKQQDKQDFIENMGKKYIKFLSIKQCANYILNSPYLQEFITTHAVDSITPIVIKKFYYYVLLHMDTIDTCISEKYDNSLLFTTKSSVHINHGPALLIVDNYNITENLEKQININHFVLKTIEVNIDFNFTLKDKIMKLKRNLEDKMSKDIDKDKKVADMRFDNETKQLIKTIELLETKYKIIKLDDMYIPNTPSHYKKWHDKKDYKTLDLFTCDIEVSYIHKIIGLDICFNYKLLLLIGIGILNNDNNEYNIIMRELADSKKLFMIIASSDYIYGTNYQFAHCYLSPNLKYITQEKIIQAIGRVGRKEKNKTFTFRILNKEHIHLLFDTNSKCIEGDKMNILLH